VPFEKAGQSGQAGVEVVLLQFVASLAIHRGGKCTAGQGDSLIADESGISRDEEITNVF
jgi:hypothetical protein